MSGGPEDAGAEKWESTFLDFPCDFNFPVQRVCPQHCAGQFDALAHKKLQRHRRFCAFSRRQKRYASVRRQYLHILLDMRSSGHVEDCIDAFSACAGPDPFGKAIIRIVESRRSSKSKSKSFNSA
jgi:hypothetical protein